MPPLLRERKKSMENLPSRTSMMDCGYRNHPPASKDWPWFGFLFVVNSRSARQNLPAHWNFPSCIGEASWQSYHHAAPSVQESAASRYSGLAAPAARHPGSSRSGRRTAPIPLPPIPAHRNTGFRPPARKTPRSPSRWRIPIAGNRRTARPRRIQMRRFRRRCPIRRCGARQCPATAACKSRAARPTGPRCPAGCPPPPAAGPRARWPGGAGGD